VIGRRHLIQNKRTAGRAQDLLDLEILEGAWLAIRSAP